MKVIVDKGWVIKEQPELLETIATRAFEIYSNLLPGPEQSKEAHELFDKKQLLSGAVALSYVAHDASLRASYLQEALQELSAFKSPDCQDKSIPSDYHSLCALFISLRGAASILLVPNKHTICAKDKRTNPSTMFGNIPLSFSAADKEKVGSILERIERHFYRIGVYETTFRLLESRFLPIARSILGRTTSSAVPLNLGAHPRNFGQKKFVDTYKAHLEGAILANRNNPHIPIAYCREDEAMLSGFESFQEDILMLTVDSTRSILKVRLFSLFLLLTYICFSFTAEQPHPASSCAGECRRSVASRGAKRRRTVRRSCCAASYAADCRRCTARPGAERKRCAARLAPESQRREGGQEIEAASERVSGFEGNAVLGFFFHFFFSFFLFLCICITTTAFLIRPHISYCALH